MSKKVQKMKFYATLIVTAILGTCQSYASLETTIPPDVKIEAPAKAENCPTYQQFFQLYEHNQDFDKGEFDISGRPWKRATMGRDFNDLVNNGVVKFELRDTFISRQPGQGQICSYKVTLTGDESPRLYRVIEQKK